MRISTQLECRVLAIFVVCLVVFGQSKPADAQRRQRQQREVISAVEKKSINGIIQSVTNHSLNVLLDTGETEEIFFQDRDVEAITLGGDRAMVRAPAKIHVQGELPIRLLRVGMALEAKLQLDKGNKFNSLESLKLLPVAFDDFDFRYTSGEPTVGKPAAAIAKGTIVKLANSKIYLKLPKSSALPNGGVVISVDKNTRFGIEDDSMHEVYIGDKVRDSEIIKFSTGEWIAKELNVDFGSEHVSVQSDPDDKLQIKYRALSDEPVAPREIRSNHFIIKTDLSERSSKILLDKLETMFKIVGKYYNRRSLGQPIYCYVANDLKLWENNMQELAPGLESIVGRAGVTVSLVGARAARVYSCGDHDVVQHEAVHAFCHLAFGSTGPVWYSEGMAELGCYWRPGDVGVNIDPVVIRYLTTATPTPLVQIVAPGQITGDSWRAYAWRWALCYMLVNNPNYSKRFYALGDSMMRPNSRANFYNEFSDVAAQISFEYLQFTKELGNGYQQGLCSWDWKTKPVGLDTGRAAKRKIEAARGWQATSAKLRKNFNYEAFARGSWSIDGATKIGPDGNQSGQGQLVGAILYEKIGETTGVPEYRLSEPFPIGTQGEFTAEFDGQLFVRCDEPMTRLGDNKGAIEFVVREAK